MAWLISITHRFIHHAKTPKTKLDADPIRRLGRAIINSCYLTNQPAAVSQQRYTIYSGHSSVGCDQKTQAHMTAMLWILLEAYTVLCRADNNISFTRYNLRTAHCIRAILIIWKDSPTQHSIAPYGVVLSARIVCLINHRFFTLCLILELICFPFACANPLSF